MSFPDASSPEVPRSSSIPSEIQVGPQEIGTPEKWWHDHEFRLVPTRRWLNNLLAEECDILQDVFERHVGSGAGADVAGAVRRDAVLMARYDVVRDAALAASQHVYGIVRFLLSWLTVSVAATILASRGPAWLELTLLLAAAFVVAMYIGSYIFPEESGGELIVTFGMIAAFVVGIGAMFGLLLFRPGPMLSTYESMGVVVIALLSAMVIVAVAHVFLSRYWQLLPGVIILVVLVALALGLWGGYVDLPLGAEGARIGLRTGVAFGLGAAIVLATSATAYQLWHKMLALRKLRMAAEAEFVQSTLLAIASVESAMRPGAHESTRAAAVADVEYMATVLERHVPTALAREDPPSASLVAEALSQRAELIRMRKRSVLLGRPGAHARLLNALVASVIPGARRDWLALHASSQASDPPPPMRRRIGHVVVQLVMVGVPVALGIISVLIDQPGLLPFAVLWAVVQLVELVTPGAGERLARSATNAERLSTPIRR